MTEKRFKYGESNLGTKGIYYDNKEILLGTFVHIKSLNEVVDLLNGQEEIITEQKEYLTRMGQGNHLKIIMEQKERIKELEQENKRLKQGKYIYGIHGGSND